VTIGLHRICIACRTAFDERGSCDGGDGHEVVALAELRERHRLIEVVWGDDDARRRIAAAQDAQLRRVRGFAFGGGAVGMLTTAWSMGWGPVGGMIGVGIGSVLAHATRRRMPTEYPRGAPPPRWGKVSARGRVRGAGGAESPASGEPCAAWMLMFRYDDAWSERVMLRVGVCAGLEIALDDGEVLRVPKGPVALAEPPQQVDDLAAARVQALINELDPLGRPAEVFAPLPYNVVVETLLFVGDRVEVLGPLERVLATGGAAGSRDAAIYRDAPPSRLVPHGLATLRRY